VDLHYKIINICIVCLIYKTIIAANISFFSLKPTNLKQKNHEKAFLWFFGANFASLQGKIIHESLMIF